MKKSQAVYVAKKGIDLEGAKPFGRIEPGAPIPLGVPELVIKDLLADGAIEPVNELGEE